MARRKEKPVPGRKLICKNRRAFRDYYVLSRYEAGMALVGSEVKSLRDGRASLGSDAYAEVKDSELFLVGCHIAEYPGANQFNHEPLRVRKLLMHKAEIRKLAIKLLERGYTLVPLQLYFAKGRAKVELGLAKGKRQYDKRAAVRQRDQARELDGEMKGR
jgi:SsrA-binding protein